MWLDGLDHVLCVRQAGEAGEQPAVEEGRVEGFGDEDDLKAEPQPVSQARYCGASQARVCARAVYHQKTLIVSSTGRMR